MANPIQTHKLLQILDIKSEKVIVIKETQYLDGNFIIPHLISQILCRETGEICLVTLHNDFEHYRVTTKKLRCNIDEYVDENRLKTVENFSNIIFEINDANKSEISERIAKRFLAEIISSLNKLNGNKYLIIDDWSHLLELGVEIRHLAYLINTLVNLDIKCVFGVYEEADGILGNALTNVADLVVDICSLKTGRSSDVTGTLNVTKKSMNLGYHFKCLDKEIQVFKPGNAPRLFM